MHILYFHQHFTTPDGASGTRSYYMAKELIAQGHKVTMVCGSLSNGYAGLDGPYHNGCRRGVVDGINVIEFDLRYSNNDGFLKRSITFLKFAIGSMWIALSTRYDLLFATSTPLTIGLPGILGRWIRRKPFVFEVRDLWPELPREMGVIRNPIILALLSMLEWLSYRSADRCIALAPGISDGIAKRGVPLDRIYLIPNGCDIDMFACGPQHAWRPPNVNKTDFMAVFAGTHGVANGLDAVLDAACELKQRNQTDIKFVLIGDGKLKPALVERTKTEKLDNVIFVSSVGKVKIAGILAEADIGLQCLQDIPSFYYGTSPNKFFDYIAAGVPVLCNYPGWVADLIRETSCGYAIPPGNSVAFADAIECAQAAPAIQMKMKENAKNLAVSQFSRDILSKQWVSWVVDGVKI
jgi:glycosyltransferase involved in cell wall biosynthesis